MYAHSYLTANGTLSSSNCVSDSFPKQAGHLVVLLLPVTAATQVCCSLPGTTRKMKPAKKKSIASFFSKGK